jgi:hypothetical protein
MSAYTDVDEARSFIVSTFNSAAAKNGWDKNQIAVGTADIQSAYDDNSNWLEINTDTGDGFWSGAFDDFKAGFGAILDPAGLPEYYDVKLTLGFWKDLYSLAAKNWVSFKNSSEILKVVGAAAQASNTAVEEEKAQQPVNQVSGGIAGTTEDIADAAKTTEETLIDPRFWYGLAAVAVLGSVGYFVRAFR